MNEIQAQTSRDFNDFAELLGQTLGAVARGLKMLRELGLSDDRFRVVTSLMHEAQRSAAAAADCWASGYYLQALAILRPAYESWLVCKWLETHPDDAHDMLDGSGNKRFNEFYKMAKDLEDTVPHVVERGFSAYAWYDEVSDLVHPRASMIGESIMIQAGGTGAVYEGPRYRREKAHSVARYLGIVAVALPTAFYRILRQHSEPEELQQIGDEFRANNSKMAAIMEAWDKEESELPPSSQNGEV